MSRSLIHPKGPAPGTDDAVIISRRARFATREQHLPERHAAIGTTGWLRPFVLGAEDGIVSTAGLILGVAAAGGGTATVLAAGTAGLVSGALSMGAGEYVSVAAQRDTEQSDIARERWELQNQPRAELQELTAIYVQRGVSEDLALQVATQLTERDALGTHLREELAIDQRIRARPWQATWLSAVSFALGAVLPLVTMLISPPQDRVALTVAVTLAVLGAAGAIGAKLGRTRILAGTLRVTAGGALAMTITWSVGSALGVRLS